MNIELKDRDGLLSWEFPDSVGEWVYFGEMRGGLNPEKCLAIGVGPDLAWLDRSMCDVLWPLLKRFADTGSLTPPKD